MSVTRHAAVLAALVATPALAAPQPLATAGLWSAYSIAEPAAPPVCGIATTGGDGRRIAIEQTAGQSGLTLLVEKPSWAIPDGTAIDLVVGFDGRPGETEHAAGGGTRLAIDLPFERSVAFMRAFRTGAEVRILFPAGNEPQWTGGLRGSSAMTDAFNACRNRIAATAATAAAPAGPTQPFGAVPTQPFTPPQSVAQQPAPAPVPPAAAPPPPAAAPKP